MFISHRAGFACLAQSETAAGGAARFFLSESIDDAIQTAAGRLRISPIFAVNDSDRNDPERPFSLATEFVAFLGPFNPSLLGSLGLAIQATWLTYGAYNVLLALENTEDLHRALAETGFVSGEVWHLAQDGSVLETIPLGGREKHDGSAFAAHLATEFPSSPHPELKDPLDEYLPLVLNSHVRARLVGSDVVGDIERVNADLVRRLEKLNALDTSDSANAAKVHGMRGTLRHLNGGLSRFSSQLLSGIEPIIENHTHYWLHSLLGIGTANLALRKLVRFVETHVGLAKLSYRLGNCKGEMIGKAPRLRAQPSKFWTKFKLTDVELTEKQEAEEIVPLVAYFSGREWFHSTQNTVSVPLETLTSCNSPEWSLATLTHELSHTIVRSCLSELLPTSRAEFEELRNLTYETRKPANLLDSVRAFLGQAIVQLDEQGPPVSGKLSTARFRELILESRHWLDELMTHVFDLLCFFNSDHKKYLQSLWLTWSTIPGIADGIPDFVVHSICAVSAKNIRRTNYPEAAGKIVLAELGKLKDEFPMNGFISEAYSYLEKNFRDLTSHTVPARMGLVKIARTFIFDSRVATELHKDSMAVGSADGSTEYSHRKLSVVPAQFRNPLKFAEALAVSKNPSPARAYWLLSTITHNCELDVICETR